MSIIEIFQKNSRIRQSSFYHLMVQVLMVKMLMQKWELKKIIGLEQINLVEIYGHVHGKALKFLVIGIVVD